ERRVRLSSEWSERGAAGPGQVRVSQVGSRSERFRSDSRDPGLRGPDRLPARARSLPRRTRIQREITNPPNPLESPCGDCSKADRAAVPGTRTRNAVVARGFQFLSNAISCASSRTRTPNSSALRNLEPGSAPATRKLVFLETLPETLAPSAINAS